MLSPPQIERAHATAIYTQRMPLADRMVELAFAAATLLALVAPRGAFIYLGLVLVATLARVLIPPHAISRAELGAQLADLARRPLSLAAFAFVAFAAMSALWAVEPLQSIDKPAQAVLMVAGLLVALAAILGLSPFSRWVAARGVCHGALLGALYLAVEFASGGFIKAALVNHTGLLPLEMTFQKVEDGRVVAIHNTIFNRHAAVLALFAWPVVACLDAWLGERRRLFAIGASAWLVAVGAIVFASYSETAKLAYVAALAVAGLVYIAPRPAHWALSGAWIAATLFIMPLLTLVFPVGNTWQSMLPMSAEDRVVVWRHTLERTADAPLLGVGADMTPVLHEREKAQDPRKNETLVPRLGQHSHNIFIQTWFELGAIGAFLLCIVGLAALRALSLLAPASRPAAFAFFAAAAAVASTGYGMWQAWLIAAFLVALSTLSLATAPPSRQALDRG